MLTYLLLSTALLTPPAGASTLPPGTPIDQAAAVQITAGGFDALEEAIAGILPEQIVIERMQDQLYCDPNDSTPLSFDIRNMVIGLEVRELQLIPQQDALEVDLQLAMTLSADSLTTSGRCFVLSANYACGMEVSANDPITTQVATTISITMDDAGVFAVEASEVELLFDPIPNPLVNTGACFLADIIDDQIRQDDAFFNNLIDEFLGPSLGDLGAEIEVPLEDALNSLNIETELALGEYPLQLALYPSLFELNEQGLVLGLGATVTPEGLSDCVLAGDGSEASDEPWPLFSEQAWDGSAHDLSLMLSKDFVDHLLWNVWATGTLCLELSDLAGAQLGTDLLGNLFGESFQELFPEDTPATLVVGADASPTARFDPDMPLFVDVQALGLGAAAGLDDRVTRVCQVGVDGWVGVELPINGATLEPGLVIEPEALVFSERYSELLAPGYAEGMADFLPTVLGTLLPEDLLPSLAIPTIQGIGLGELDWQVHESDMWLGGFAWVDTENVEPIELDTSGCANGVGCSGGGIALGCDDVLGCGDGGCEGEEGCEGGGCGTHGRVRLPAGRIFLGFTMLSMLLLRRRE